jgi:hypothetical protein
MNPRREEITSARTMQVGSVTTGTAGRSGESDETSTFPKYRRDASPTNSDAARPRTGKPAQYGRYTPLSPATSKGSGAVRESTKEPRMELTPRR